MVLLVSLIFFNILMMFKLLILSNAPVGSSAKITSGLLTKSLAIATLCCCPPDN